MDHLFNYNNFYLNEYLKISREIDYVLNIGISSVKNYFRQVGFISQFDNWLPWLA